MRKPLKRTRIRYCHDCGHMEFKCPGCRQWHSIERIEPDFGNVKIVGHENVLVTLFGGPSCSVTIDYEELRKIEKKLGMNITAFNRGSTQ